MQRPRLPSPEPEDVAGRNLKGENALADPVEVNSHRLRRLLPTGSGARRRRAVGFLLPGLIGRLITLLFVFLNFFFVAFGGEWRRQILAQHREVNAARRTMRIARHIKSEDRWADVRTGGEVKILAALIKCSVRD